MPEEMDLLGLPSPKEDVMPMLDDDIVALMNEDENSGVVSDENRRGRCGYLRNLWNVYDRPSLVIIALNSFN